MSVGFIINYFITLFLFIQSEIEGAEAKPEVVVTKAKGEEDGKDKMANYLNLIPAPTPTR